MGEMLKRLVVVVAVAALYACGDRSESTTKEPTSTAQALPEPPVVKDNVFLTDERDQRHNRAVKHILGVMWVKGSKLEHFALPSLQKIDGSLVIYDNPELESLDLGALTEVGGDVEIVFNEDLDSLEGLRSLVSVGGNLTIERANDLGDLNGLEHLESVGGDLTIRNNDGLGAFRGLTGLRSVSGTLSIVRCHKLASTAGFKRLARVGGDLNIIQNKTLADLDGFKDLAELSAKLNVESNPALPTCAGITLRDRLGAGDRRACILSNSKDGCAKDVTGCPARPPYFCGDTPCGDISIEEEIRVYSEQERDAEQRPRGDRTE